MSSVNTKAKLVLSGVGGQGLMLVAKLLGDTCLRAEIPITSLEDHGMSQRGGAIGVRIQFGNNKGLDFQPGQADVIIALEPMEATRHAHYLKENGVVVVDTTPINPLTISMDKDREYPPIEDLLAPFKQVKAKVLQINARQQAKELGETRAANVVMLGAAVAFDVLPVTKEQMEETLRSVLPPRIVDVNLRAFQKGWELGKASLST